MSSLSGLGIRAGEFPAYGAKYGLDSFNPRFQVGLADSYYNSMASFSFSS